MSYSAVVGRKWVQKWRARRQNSNRKIVKRFVSSLIFLTLFFLGFARHNLLRFQELERELIAFSQRTVPVLQTIHEMEGLLEQTKQSFAEAVESEDVGLLVDVDATAESFQDEIALLGVLLPDDPSIASVDQAYTRYVDLGKGAVLEFLQEQDVRKLGTLSQLDELIRGLSQALEGARQKTEIEVHMVMAQIQRMGTRIHQLLYMVIPLIMLIAGLGIWLVYRRANQLLSQAFAVTRRLGQGGFLNPGTGSPGP